MKEKIRKQTRHKMNPIFSLRWRCLSSVGFHIIPSDRKEMQPVFVEIRAHAHVCLRSSSSPTHTFTRMRSKPPQVLATCLGYVAVTIHPGGVTHTRTRGWNSGCVGVIRCNVSHKLTRTPKHNHTGCLILLKQRLHSLRYKQTAQWPLIILVFTLTDEKFSWVWPLDL